MVKVLIFIVYGIVKLGIDSDYSIKFQIFLTNLGGIWVCLMDLHFYLSKKKFDLQFLGLWPTQYRVTELSKMALLYMHIGVRGNREIDENSFLLKRFLF